MSKIKTIVGAKHLQKYMQVGGAYTGAIDGILGVQSIAAAVALLQGANVNDASAWPPSRVMLALTQLMFIDLGFSPGKIDGLYGPNTDSALEKFQDLIIGSQPLADDTKPEFSGNNVWPVYRDMERFYGPVGQNVELYDLPYPMVLAWDTDETVTRISLHTRCAQSALGVLEANRDHYGIDALDDMGMTQFGGSFNVRKMRGGENYSVHAWAAAIDFDPLRNQFRWNHLNAKMDDPEFDMWWKLWEGAGWVSLGRERNFDWMHLQAVRL